MDHYILPPREEPDGDVRDGSVNHRKSQIINQ